MFALITLRNGIWFNIYWPVSMLQAGIHRSMLIIEAKCFLDFIRVCFFLLVSGFRLLGLSPWYAQWIQHNSYILIQVLQNKDPIPYWPNNSDPSSPNLAVWEPNQRVSFNVFQFDDSRNLPNFTQYVAKKKKPGKSEVIFEVVITTSFASLSLINTAFSYL